MNEWGEPNTIREWWEIEKEQWKHIHIFPRCILLGIFAYFIYFILKIGYDIIMKIFTRHWPASGHWPFY